MALLDLLPNELRILILNRIEDIPTLSALLRTPGLAPLVHRSIVRLNLSYDEGIDWFVLRRLPNLRSLLFGKIAMYSREEFLEFLERRMCRAEVVYKKKFSLEEMVQ